MSRALPSVPLCRWLQAPGHLQRCCLDFTRWDAARQGVPAPGRVRQPSRQPTFLSQGGCGLSRPWRTSTDTRTHEPPVHAHAAHTTVHGCPRSLTHTHAHSYMLMLTLTRRLPHMLAHAHTLTHQGKHMGSHTGLYTHRLTQTRAHSMLAHTQIPSHTRTRTLTHAHT